MIVAIDGPAGVGKSSIASQIAQKFSFFNLNSGNFYRAIALKACQKGISIENSAETEAMALTCTISIENNKLHLDGQDVENQLHSDQVDKIVAQVSALVPIRHFVNDTLSKLSQSMDLVAEGRDMTTVVFPHAEVKIFLDAPPETRAQRRFDQGVSELSYEEILSSIIKRDQIDRNKEEGSLKIADDALYLDTSTLTLEQVCEKVSDKIIELQ